MFPGLTQFPEGQIIAFALVFLRFMAFVIAWPVFGSATVPVYSKVLLAVVMSVVVFPTLHFANADLIQINDQIIFMAFRELMIGLCLGFLMRTFFFAISVAGELISVSIGLASAQLFNPAMGSQGNVMEQFEMAIATLFFLALNGHHVFISGIVQSFDLVPVAAIAIKTQGLSGFSNIVQDVVLTGIKISAPILVAIFLTNLAMGVVGRAVPQINVLVTSMPVTLLLGLTVLIVTTPLFVGEMSGIINNMAERFFQVMKVI